MRASTLVGLVGLLVSARAAHAATYYLSSSGNDANDGTSASTPWQTLGKLNASSALLAPGDSVLFNRGDTFYGSLTPTRSGTAAAPITYGAYGQGSAPVLSGFSTLSSWTDTGGNVWEAAVPGGPATVNSVVLGGAFQPMGRYPRASDPNAGYLSFQSHTGDTAITDASLSGGPDFTGGEIVIRIAHWYFHRAAIRAHAGATLTFDAVAAPDVYPLVDGSGYFVQNHRATLAQDGDWYYDAASGKLGLYHAGPPPSVQVATVDDLVAFANRSYLTFTGLRFEGANANGLSGNASSFITVSHCEFAFAGTHAVLLVYSSDVAVEDNTITGSVSEAVTVYSPHHDRVAVRRNVIQDTGLVAGMGRHSGYGTHHEAIRVSVNSGATLEANAITNTGYLPIWFDGSDVLVQHNVIDRFCFVLDDGAGIYTYNGGGSTPAVLANRTITRNIISNGIGAAAGTTSGLSQANGIYLDLNSNHVSITENTVFDVANTGAHFNNPQSVSMTGNTFYNAGNGWSVGRWTGNLQEIADLEVEDNVFFSGSAEQRSFEYADNGVNVPAPSTVEQRMASMGVIDRNYFHTTDGAGFKWYYRNSSSSAYSFPLGVPSSHWARLTGHETNATLLPSIPLYEIRGTVGANRYPNGGFDSDIAGVGGNGSGVTVATAWDGTGKLDGPGSLAVTVTGSTAYAYGWVYSSVGAVEAGKSYVLRLSTLGTTEDGLLRVRLRKTTSPWTALTPLQTAAFGTSRVDHEFLLQVPTSESAASWELTVHQCSGTVYVDDVEFFEVDAAPVDFDQRVRFEVNSTSASRTVLLGKSYVDPRGNHYCDSVVLEPYTSLLLLDSAEPCLPALDAGIADGGAADSEAADGAEPDGGAADGAEADGGTIDGGTADGGAAPEDVGPTGGGDPAGDPAGEIRSGCGCGGAGGEAGGRGLAFALLGAGCLLDRSRRRGKAG